MGFNVVRLGFHWHKVEPEPGKYDQQYLKDLQSLVDRFTAKDIYIILDMHQDMWSPIYCKGHGIPPAYAQPYNTPEYQHGGVKAYPEPATTPEYGPDGMVTQACCDKMESGVFGWATSYLTYATGAASQRLYDNEDGLLDRYGDFWQTVARMFQNYSSVLAYEIMNEPWLGDAPLSLEELFNISNPHRNLWFPGVSDKENMQKLNSALHKAIRWVDNNTIIFFEPATGGNYLDAFDCGYDEGPGGVEYNDKQALAYHVYCPIIDDKTTSSFIRYLIEVLSLEACDGLTDFMFDNRHDDTERLGLAGFLTEFGNVGTTQISAEDIDFGADKMDSFLHSWSYWYLTPEPGMNMSRPDLKALTRTYAQAVPGKVISMSFDLDSAHFTLMYSPSKDEETFSQPVEVYNNAPVHYPYGVEWSTEPEGALKAEIHNVTIVFYHTDVAKGIPQVILHIFPKAPRV